MSSLTHKGCAAVSTLLIYILIVSTKHFAFADNVHSGIEDSPLTEVRAVKGGRVLLPCEMDPPVANDTTHLVLFFRAGTGTPIYSLDARSSGHLEKGSHWAEDSLKGRALINLSRGKRGLLLEHVRLEDQGEYRCRVDFLESPTRNLRIRLHVIVPSTLKITDDLNAGREVKGVVGPFTEGSPLTLSCYVTGGQPSPRVTWWHGGYLLDDDSEIITSQSVRNILTLPPLNQDDLNKTLTCQANNSDLTIPISGAVTIDMTYPPKSLKLHDIADHVTLSEGITRQLVCEAEGSRPPAHITWWMGGLPLEDPQTVDVMGNLSRSTLSFTADSSDDGSVLTCKAVSPNLPNDALFNSTKLTVLYKPKLNLQLGLSLNLEDLEEGDDVYFKCNMEANPAVTGIQWAHNGVPLRSDPSAGVIISPASLVLQSVTRKSSGTYTCAAANTQGAATSNALQMNVKFLPLCAENQQTVFGAAKHEVLEVPCKVTSYPAPTAFRWAMNSSSGLVDVALNLTTNSGSTSIISYTPQTYHDFGSLLCWAINDLGQQKEPCVFNILPVAPTLHSFTAKPESVSGCVAERNATMPPTYLVVKCIPGWDGGLRQTFTLEVRKADTQETLDEFRLAAQPFFVVARVQLDVEYLLTITAANSRGSSPPYTITYTAHSSSADKVISPDAHTVLLTITPFLVLLIGVMVGVIVCVGVGVVMSRRRRKRKSGAEILYAGPLKDNYDSKDVHTLICVSSECEKQDGIQWGGKTGSLGNCYVSPDILNNSNNALETDSLLREKLSALQGLAPLASTDSLGRCSTHSSTCTTSSKTPSFKSSSRVSNSNTGIHPEIQRKMEIEETSETPLMELPRESCV
ncbi:protein turtle homolog B-like isoform X1 [Macrobrachium rosenbergii]|uniref:protein turtle homolog B-like isoform X1 n=1 Tax=Macrobrachium rosenbergii TaxID=79674 RepID=UPI0034D407C4